MAVGEDHLLIYLSMFVERDLVKVSDIHRVFIDGDLLQKRRTVISCVMLWMQVLGLVLALLGIDLTGIIGFLELQGVGSGSLLAGKILDIAVTGGVVEGRPDGLAVAVLVLEIAGGADVHGITDAATVINDVFQGLSDHLHGDAAGIGQGTTANLVKVVVDVEHRTLLAGVVEMLNDGLGIIHINITILVATQMLAAIDGHQPILVHPDGTVLLDELHDLQLRGAGNLTDAGNGIGIVVLVDGNTQVMGTVSLTDVKDDAQVFIGLAAKDGHRTLQTGGKAFHVGQQMPGDELAQIRCGDMCKTAVLAAEVH